MITKDSFVDLCWVLCFVVALVYWAVRIAMEITINDCAPLTLLIFAGVDALAIIYFLRSAYKAWDWVDGEKVIMMRSKHVTVTLPEGGDK